MSKKGDRVAQVVRCHSWLHVFTIFMLCGSLIANVVILDYLLDKSNKVSTVYNSLRLIL